MDRGQGRPSGVHDQGNKSSWIERHYHDYLRSGYPNGSRSGFLPAVALPERNTHHTQMGSLAFYFLTTGHVSRAWVMVGLAIRLALALGLHLRNEDVGVGESNKESRVLTWWSLNSIECLMSTTTGRPPAVAVEDCTVPLPHSLPGELEKTSRRRTERGFTNSTQSRDTSDESLQTKSPGQHHLDRINVTVIMQKVLIDLYSPRTAAKSWEVCLMLHLVWGQTACFWSPKPKQGLTITACDALLY
jgi:hypothetical protein